MPVRSRREPKFVAAYVLHDTRQLIHRTRCPTEPQDIQHARQNGSPDHPPEPSDWCLRNRSAHASRSRPREARSRSGTPTGGITSRYCGKPPQSSPYGWQRPGAITDGAPVAPPKKLWGTAVQLPPNEGKNRGDTRKRRQHLPPPPPRTGTRTHPAYLPAVLSRYASSADVLLRLQRELQTQKPTLRTIGPSRLRKHRSIKKPSRRHQSRQANNHVRSPPSLTA